MLDLHHRYFLIYIYFYISHDRTTSSVQCGPRSQVDHLSLDLSLGHGEWNRGGGKSNHLVACVYNTTGSVCIICIHNTTGSRSTRVTFQYRYAYFRQPAYRTDRSKTCAVICRIYIAMRCPTRSKNSAIWYNTRVFSTR